MDGAPTQRIRIPGRDRFSLNNSKPAIMLETQELDKMEEHITDEWFLHETETIPPVPSYRPPRSTVPMGQTDGAIENEIGWGFPEVIYSRNRLFSDGSYPYRSERY